MLANHFEEGIMRKIFADIPDEKWYDWKWQIANRIMDVETLAKYFPLTEDEKNKITKVLAKFRMAITPYYLSIINPDDINDPVRKQAIPSIFETIIDPTDLNDPLHEDIDSPVPGLTHRYPDRVLLLTTHICSMYCRHCTRRRKVGDNEDSHFPKAQLEKGIEYIRNTPEVRDVIVSGGDPLTMADSQLEWLLSEIRKIEHVEIIRIGTRTPVVMPMRITENVCKIMRKYGPIYVNTHFNHYNEITKDAKKACDLLADHGLILGNQTVLLRGVNDNPAIMKKLMHELLKIRVRPYYIYQCDLSEGISHFRTPVSTGIEIIENLRGHTSGLAVPHYVIDTPGGGGKVPVMPNYVLSQATDRVVLRNYEGRIVTYNEPSEQKIAPAEAPEELKKYYSKDGVAELINTGKESVDYDKLAKKGPKHSA
jgi:lysine 2,3-aminomutase